jgi:type IV secretory pathway VirB10-like protein
MDEVIQKRTFKAKVFEKLTGIFIVEPISFSSKKRINFRGIAYLTSCFLGMFCLLVFMMPTQELQTRSYNERKTEPPTPNGSASSPAFSDPYGQNLMRPSAQGSSGFGANAMMNRNTSMIISRDNDSSTTLPPGTVFWVKLAQSATVTNSAIPVIGIVASHVSNSSSLAIPEEARIYGEAVLDSESERASIVWKSIQFPDGRSKSLTALALGSDNQAGVEGEYHSDAVKNTTGQMISRFIGGFADGAIERSPLGGTKGGVQNGIYQGLADTAKDRAEAWSEDLKKPRAWIELREGMKFQAILSQPFVFRDPGGVY